MHPPTLESVCVEQLDTPIGPMSLTVREDGALVGLSFGADSAAERHGAASEASRQIAEYFRGERREFDLALAPRGTPFQQRVWAELCRIPFGETISYRQLADRIGNPAALRAVGRANGSNPIALVIPCHRVIATGGGLGGYTGGLAIKRRLLEFEGARPTLF